MTESFGSKSVELDSPINDGESVDISIADHSFSVVTRAVYVGTGGDVLLTTSFGTSLTLSNVQDGSFLPIRAAGITKTGTTALNIVGMW